jgi:c-di-GMP-binding flagellar brake protein YcgR
VWISNKVDQRQARRFSFSGKATYEVSISQVSHKKQATKMEGQIQNVSESGICFVTTEALKNTQIVKLEFPLPVNGPAIPTVVEVRWVRRTPGKKAYQVGLRFLL